MLDAKTVVVVVNGFHALALCNTGTAPEPQLELLWDLSDEATVARAGYTRVCLTGDRRTRPSSTVGHRKGFS
jgi:hypothetical protein